MKRSTRKRRYASIVLGVLLAVGAALVLAALQRYRTSSLTPALPILPDARTRIGINLSGLATFNRQQVFSDVTAQTEWFSSRGGAWTILPSQQLDRFGWPRYLEAGQTAPRPLMLPPASIRSTTIICHFDGTGELSGGGLARIVKSDADRLELDLALTGNGEEGAWLELLKTDPNDPVREIDCRENDRPRKERFHPSFLAFLQGFKILRFLDWQRTNDNFSVGWEERSLPRSSSQVAPAGASIEDMVDLANIVEADPWFLMPYNADDHYIESFAKTVRANLSSNRIVYVELGNEIWNDMFPAARQAGREGTMLQMGDGDVMNARALRYAQKLCRAMRIWQKVYSDRPERLIRLAASQNAYPELSNIVLGQGGAAQCVDVLATAPYIWLDLKGFGASDTEKVFAQLPNAIDETIAFAVRHRAIAARYGKRFIAYEGGQHLVTPDLALARSIQRDRRMQSVYLAYLNQWDTRVRSDLVLYASSAPIADYGSWGLQEYSGQPVQHAPKLAAVRRFMAAMDP